MMSQPPPPRRRFSITAIILIVLVVLMATHTATMTAKGGGLAAGRNIFVSSSSAGSMSTTAEAAAAASALGEDPKKQACEMNFWRSKYKQENGRLVNNHYQRLYTDFFNVVRRGRPIHRPSHTTRSDNNNTTHLESRLTHTQLPTHPTNCLKLLINQHPNVRAAYCMRYAVYTTCAHTVSHHGTSDLDERTRADMTCTRDANDE